MCIGGWGVGVENLFAWHFEREIAKLKFELKTVMLSGCERKSSTNKWIKLPFGKSSIQPISFG